MVVSSEEIDEKLKVFYQVSKNIEYETTAALKKIECIDRYRDTIWYDGYEDIVSEANGVLERLQYMKRTLDKYIEMYLGIGEEESVSLSPLSIYGIDFSIFKSNEEGEEPCTLDENELKLRYEQCINIVFEIRRNRACSSIEIDFMINILDISFILFNRIILDKKKLEKIQSEKRI